MCSFNSAESWSPARAAAASSTRKEGGSHPSSSRDHRRTAVSPSASICESISPTRSRTSTGVVAASAFGSFRYSAAACALVIRWEDRDRSDGRARAPSDLEGESDEREAAADNLTEVCEVLVVRDALTAAHHVHRIRAAGWII